MTRLIPINRYFFPDESATSQYLSGLTFALAGQGFSVAVVSSVRLAFSAPTRTTIPVISSGAAAPLKSRFQRCGQHHPEWHHGADYQDRRDGNQQVTTDRPSVQFGLLFVGLVGHGPDYYKTARGQTTSNGSKPAETGI